jgi:hypothetical protein
MAELAEGCGSANLRRIAQELAIFSLLIQSTGEDMMPDMLKAATTALIIAAGAAYRERGSSDRVRTKPV